MTAAPTICLTCFSPYVYEVAVELDDECPRCLARRAARLEDSVVKADEARAEAEAEIAALEESSDYQRVRDLQMAVSKAISQLHQLTAGAGDAEYAQQLRMVERGLAEADR